VVKIRGHFKYKLGSFLQQFINHNFLNNTISTCSPCTSMHCWHRYGTFIMILSKKFVVARPAIVAIIRYDTSRSALNIFPPTGLFEQTEQVKIACTRSKLQAVCGSTSQCPCCQSGGVQTRVVVEETDVFDWSTSSFWTKGWHYSVFKKLRIISCVGDSLFYQKIDE
jgi:hypothetical protein